MLGRFPNYIASHRRYMHPLVHERSYRNSTLRSTTALTVLACPVWEGYGACASRSEQTPRADRAAVPVSRRLRKRTGDYAQRRPPLALREPPRAPQCHTASSTPARRGGQEAKGCVYRCIDETHAAVSTTPQHVQKRESNEVAAASATPPHVKRRKSNAIEEAPSESARKQPDTEEMHQSRARVQIARRPTEKRQKIRKTAKTAKSNLPPASRVGIPVAGAVRPLSCWKSHVNTR
ncbi:hypothetical protein PHYPSEUDO_011825 [Phytophthora pseudosyringae]|uniref:Uncharacterized protein n=1 Tax=Phytophthora pseudosyringae TaxID=221518 RepID=A0A8T1W6C0_9STRA|nr:hypothetical protein PHYPSEUDO_011825 [Phytophthora pseudosyringae]